MSDSLKNVAACAAAFVGAYGSYETLSVWPAFLGVVFVASFSWTLRRAKVNASPPWLQLVLVLNLVALSFALHLTYLPAGICCFFCLMLTNNELLLPPPQPPPAEKSKKSKSK